MNHEDIIKKKIGKNHGFKVPEGFLEPVYKQVRENLPERKPIEFPQRTMWQRVRPYVYLAAMFLGLWATMKIVTTLKVQQQPVVSLDNPPALVAQAISTPEVEEQLNLAMEANDIAIVNDAVAAYDNIEDFQQDFDYQFEDKVQDIDIEALRTEAVTNENSSDAPEIQIDDIDFDIDEDLFYDYYAML